MSTNFKSKIFFHNESKKFNNKHKIPIMMVFFCLTTSAPKLTARSATVQRPVPNFGQARRSSVLVGVRCQNQDEK